VKGVEASSDFAHLIEGYNGHFNFGMGEKEDMRWRKNSSKTK